MIELQNIKKTYKTEKGRFEALKGISLNVEKSDIYGVIGFSGAGKSTLIRCINLLERPDSGKVFVNGEELTALSENELRIARQKIGMIFQQFNLLRSKTVFQNVAFPLQHSGLNKKDIKVKVDGLLELVGLTEKSDSYPSQLSGGQKQRIGIARALARDPQVLLSDEATSALDPQTTHSILALLNDLNKKLGLTIVLITHEMGVIKEICNKVAVIESGKIVEQGDSVDIFSNPQHPTTQNFIANVFQTEKINGLLRDEKISTIIKDNGIIVRMLFTGTSANNAYISEVSKEFNIAINVIFGNIEIIQKSPIGSLFSVFNGTSEDVTAAINYLKSEMVQITVINEKAIITNTEREAI
ncbi:methionine ABC transporter ATP-binding protein [Clostridium algoriphilum]|uniref:methionine ABC transporter ATP-binding protein n=1 Tax=Clostridium algoriphilum TaxID=198347 RepID=UPI001CF508EC|nr:methionine ABC transporter ATP-binding protein [Clostridium algoriphilum]MCB2294823.1 methionine ABC transporter ATP-binding protein [Clostridium algoriphilum]